ncbi:MAG: class I SAM-dependent methyltransferase [Chloroflexota bacterium]
MDELIREQIRYYRARAGEYDQWFLRRGRYDRGWEANREWFAEVDQLRERLDDFRPAGQVLELAGGTGIWTAELAHYADHITVVDSSPEVLAINRARAGMESVTYLQADLFSWQPEHLYDVVFFGFWLSHVPEDRFAAFWDTVARCLRPGGRLFFVDSLRAETSTAVDHQLGSEDSTLTTRRLNDGQEFRIVKIFYVPEELQARLASLGWEITVRSTPRYFVYGHGRFAGDGS